MDNLLTLPAPDRDAALEHFLGPQAAMLARLRAGLPPADLPLNPKDGPQLSPQQPQTAAPIPLPQAALSSPMQPRVQPDMLNRLAQIRGYDNSAVDPAQVASREANGANALIAALQGQQRQMVADHRARMADRDMAAQGQMQAARDRYPNSLAFGSTYGDGADVARLAADAVINSDSLPLGQKLDAGWALGARRYPTSIASAADDPAGVRAQLAEIVSDPRARQQAMMQRGRYQVPATGRTITDTGTEVSRSEIHPGGIRLEGPAGKYGDKEAYNKTLVERQKFQRDKLRDVRRESAEENLTNRSRSRDQRIANQAIDLMERLKMGPAGGGDETVAMIRQLQRAGLDPRAAAAIVGKIVEARGDREVAQITADAKAKANAPPAAPAAGKDLKAPAEPVADKVVTRPKKERARDRRFTPTFGPESETTEMTDAQKIAAAAKTGDLDAAQSALDLAKQKEARRTGAQATRDKRYADLYRQRSDRPR